MIDFEDKHDRDEELELALQKALRPVVPPAGFAERVIERSQNLQASELPASGRRSGFHPTLRWAIAAVLLLTLATGGFLVHRRQRRIEGERARDQVLLALRLTGITIRAVRNQIAADNHNNGQKQETP